MSGKEGLLFGEKGVGTPDNVTACVLKEKGGKKKNQGVEVGAVKRKNHGSPEPEVNWGKRNAGDDWKTAPHVGFQAQRWGTQWGIELGGEVERLEHYL